MSYCNLGRHEEALVLQLQVLMFNQRVLQQDHPVIGHSSTPPPAASGLPLICLRAGITMGNLAMTYSALAMFDKALPLQQAALQFSRRVLHEGHPRLGERPVGRRVSPGTATAFVVCFCFCFCFCGVISLLICSVVGAAMRDLAATYVVLGRHDEALELQQEVLEFNRRVLPEDHPHIGEGGMRVTLLRCF
jgi:hypothetical protein